jgi:hypothetical protein
VHPLAQLDPLALNNLLFPLHNIDPQATLQTTIMGRTNPKVIVKQLGVFLDALLGLTK